MKALKFVGLALLAVLMPMALGLAVTAWRFDPAWAKQKLTQAVHEQKQRVLKIDGDLALQEGSALCPVTRRRARP
jgi:uncharacterized protein involved in outer membrane biogenesis